MRYGTAKLLRHWEAERLWKHLEMRYGTALSLHIGKRALAVKTPRNEVWNSLFPSSRVVFICCENTSKWGMEQHNNINKRNRNRLWKHLEMRYETAQIQEKARIFPLWKHLEMRYGTAFISSVGIYLWAVKTPRNEVWNSLETSQLEISPCCENTSKWGMEQLRKPGVFSEFSCENTSKWGMEQLATVQGYHHSSCENTSKWGMEQRYCRMFKPEFSCENTSKWGMEQPVASSVLRVFCCENTSKWGMEQLRNIPIRNISVLWKHLEMRYGTALLCKG